MSGIIGVIDVLYAESTPFNLCGDFGFLDSPVELRNGPASPQDNQDTLTHTCNTIPMLAHDLVASIHDHHFSYELKFQEVGSSRLDRTSDRSKSALPGANRLLKLYHKHQCLDSVLTAPGPGRIPGS